MIPALQELQRRVRDEAITRPEMYEALSAILASAPADEPCAWRYANSPFYWHDCEASPPPNRGDKLVYAYPLPQPPPAPEHVERLLEALLDARDECSMSTYYTDKSVRAERDAAEEAARAALLAAYRPAAVSVVVDGVAYDLDDMVKLYNTAKLNWDTCLQERDEARAQLAPVQSALSERERNVIAFALLMLASDAREKANWYAQKHVGNDTKKAHAFLKDAADAERIRDTLLRAAPTCPPAGEGS